MPRKKAPSRSNSRSVSKKRVTKAKKAKKAPTKSRSRSKSKKRVTKPKVKK